MFYCTHQPKHKKIHTVTQTFCQLNIFSVKKAISFVAVTKMNDPQTELLARGKNGKNIFLVLGNMLWMHISKWHLPLFPASLHQSKSIKLPTVCNISHQNSIYNNNEHNIYCCCFLQYMNITHYQNYIVHTKRQLHIFSFCHRTPSHATELLHAT